MVHQDVVPAHELVWNSSMLVSAVILAVTFIGIFTEGIHKIHRAKIALLGAALMVVAGQIAGFYNPDLALEAIDWNVVFLLGAMMTIIAVMIPTGGFQAIAYWIAAFSKGRLFVLMVLLGTAVAVISTLLDNVTTVVIFGPLIVLICQTMNVNPVPYLMAAAILSNTGGVATLVGDPPNLMIGSAANIDFNTFVLHMGGLVICASAVTVIGLRYVFRKNLSETPEPMSLDSANVIEDPRTWYASLIVLGVMVILFILHTTLHWEAWVVAAMGMTAIFFLARNVHMDDVLREVELSLLLFFLSLFVLVGGVENSHFLEYIGTFILPFVQEDLLTASIILMWVAALLSAAIDNIPFTAAMIPIILGMEASGVNVTPLWWALAVGAGMGGNGTHLGATANVFVVTLSERIAAKEGNPALAITPGLWFRKGTPVMLLALAVSSVIMWMFFEFFASPLP